MAPFVASQLGAHFGCHAVCGPRRIGGRSGRYRYRSVVQGADGGVPFLVG